MTSDYPCVTTTAAVSSPLTMVVAPLSVNKDSIYVTKPIILPGQVDTFVVIATHGGLSPVYQWYINGVAVAGATNATYITSTLVDGQVITCSVTSSDPCTSPKTGASNSIRASVGSGLTDANKALNEFRLMPNPNTGDFTISGILKKYGDGNVSISITDMLGQTIFKKTVVVTNNVINEHIVLNKSIANAMYLVKIAYGDDHQIFHVVIDR